MLKVSNGGEVMESVVSAMTNGKSHDEFYEGKWYVLRLL